jgi:methionyl-tRNA synthetase
MSSKFYVTTPIYYVNGEPHIGHVYTTAVADVLARYHRLKGDDTFFLTGTDEYATKVVDSAADNGVTPFEDTFQRLGMTHDDFIRTTQDRHTTRVKQYVSQLQECGDVYLGEYEGWYDAGQEEYVPENKAKESDYKSPVNGKPLIRRTEDNYFFRLSAYGDALLQLLGSGEVFDVQPTARKNEVIARIREGLNDIPISRTGGGDWGISMPGDDAHTIYVWIDALFNYLSTVDTDDRRKYWSTDVHLIGKEILWFHAVIWPAMLLALNKLPGNEWIRLPRLLYTHSQWISEGKKMSKSLGNFIDLAQIDNYVETFGLDALRYFLATRGPLGTTDSDFAESKFIETYNTDLANTFGNCFSRVSNMTGRYFDGKLPAPGEQPESAGDVELDRVIDQGVRDYTHAMEKLDLSKAADAAMGIVRAVDSYIEVTQPFQLAKQEGKLPQVGTVLYNCAESLRVASLMLWPFMPEKVEEMWRRTGCGHYADALADRGRGDFEQWRQWGQSKPGTEVKKGDSLFPRFQSAKA